MACIVAMSMLAVGAPAATAGDSVDGDLEPEAVHTLENGEDLYLVFGADLSDQSLEEYVEAHAGDDAGTADANQEATAEITQYQDVEQVNINQQGGAVSIAIDGGEATAVQEADQMNANTQAGEATAENEIEESHETQFEEVGDVYLVLGNGDGQAFDGWATADGDGETVEVTQKGESQVKQDQHVDQTNYNEQNTAFALAVNNSTANAYQQSEQLNYNLQEGVANATNVYAGSGEYVDQSATATLTQTQDVEQTNYNEQGAAVAIAIGEGSSATAVQLTEQTNINEQIASADAANVFESMGGMNIAETGVEDGSDVVTTESSSDDEKNDKKDKKDKKKGDGDADGDVQHATSAVHQGQAVEQLNVNLQNTAMAIAIDDSEANAYQIAEQRNYNAQIGYADALNVYAGPSYTHESVSEAQSTTVTLGGDELEDEPGMTLDYDGDAEQHHDVEQSATAEIDQSQVVSQANFNEQHVSLAIAEDGGEANAQQMSIQENENVQFSAVAATNVWAAA